MPWEQRYSSTSAGSSLASPSAKRTRAGRPPNSPSGPSTPRRRRRQSGELMAAKRHEQKITNVRQDAARLMWEKRRGGREDDGGGGSSAPEDPGGMEEGEQVQGGQDGEVEEGQGGQIEGSERDGGEAMEVDVGTGPATHPLYGKMARMTFQRRFDNILEVFQRECTSWQVQGDVVMRILTGNSGESAFDRMKVAHKVSDERWQENGRPLSNLASRTIRHKAKLLRESLCTSEEPELSLDHLIQKHVLQDETLACILTEMGMIIPTLWRRPKEMISDTFVSVLQELVRRSGATRVVANEAAIETAKRAGLRIDTRGDITALASGLNCNRRYAKKVLECLSSGDHRPLQDRVLRRDAICGTDFPARLEAFSMRQENARPVPDETISVAYGVRKDKYLLRKSRSEVIEAFLAENEDCTYSKRVLKRVFPRNVIKGGFPSNCSFSDKCIQNICFRQ